MRVYTPLVFMALVAFAGCAPQAESPPVDLEAERAALMEADSAWSKSVGDLEAFVSFFAEGAYFLPPGLPLAVGQDEIGALATRMFSDPGMSLTWKATKADVAKSADLGYTIGAYLLTRTDEAGGQMRTVGKYVTVWRKQADGKWKVATDCFNADGPAAPVEPEPAAQ